MSDWLAYSPALVKRILNPLSVGHWTFEEAEAKKMFLAVGRSEGLTLYFLVDPEDGVIADARFQAFGESALIGMVDLTCRFLLRKTYVQALQFKLEQLAGEGGCILPTLYAIPHAVKEAMHTCHHLPVLTPIAPPLPTGDGPYPGWEELSEADKRALIQEVIDRDIQPYISLDAGGVTIKHLIGDEVILTYAGSCTSCFSAIGTTLQAIDQILKAKLHPKLCAVADPASLQLGPLFE